MADMRSFIFSVAPILTRLRRRIFRRRERFTGGAADCLEIAPGSVTYSAMVLGHGNIGRERIRQGECHNGPYDLQAIRSVEL